MTKPNVSALVVRRIYKSDRRTLFGAFSQADQMSRWFCPWPDGSAKVSNQFEVGGSYRILMRSPEGKEYAHTGEYQEIVPNRKIVFTWNSPAVQDTVVTVELHDVDGGTELVLTHEFLPDMDAYNSHQEGWQGCLANLANAAEEAGREVVR